MNICDLCGKRAYDEGFMAIYLDDKKTFDLCKECNDEWIKAHDKIVEIKVLKADVEHRLNGIHEARKRLYEAQKEAALKFVADNQMPGLAKLKATNPLQ